jgi:hypothetical protein
MEKNNRQLYSGLTAIAFVLFGIYLIFTSDEYEINPTIVLGIGVITVLFFELVAVLSFKDLFKKKD